MIATSAYVIALIASMIWFSLALHLFGFKQHAAAAMLIPRASRTSPLFRTTAASVRFLGGMNGAFALLCAVLLVAHLQGVDAFTSPVERSALLAVIGSAHLSQFLGNVPILRGGERQGEAYWPVLSGPMRIIFVVDGAQAVLCLGTSVLVS